MGDSALIWVNPAVGGLPKLPKRWSGSVWFITPGTRLANATRRFGVTQQLAQVPGLGNVAD